MSGIIGTPTWDACENCKNYNCDKGACDIPMERFTVHYDAIGEAFICDNYIEEE